MTMYCVAVVTVVYLVGYLGSEAAVTNGCSYNGSLATLSPAPNEACGCVVTANKNLSLHIDIDVIDVQMDGAATCWPVVRVMGKYYMCVRENATHSTLKYMMQNEKLPLYIYNTQHDSVSVTATFTASTGKSSDFNVTCQPYSQWPSDKECPCPVTGVSPIHPASDTDMEVGTRFLIGFLSAFFFLCAVGGICICHRWYKSRQESRKAANLLRVPRVAKTNMAFDGSFKQSKGSGIYAEIRDPHSRSFDILPDAILNLSLQTPSGSVDDGYKGSSDSGLYSMPHNGIHVLPGSSYAEVRPESPYATVDNFETISPYETAPAHTRRPHTPPQPALPLTAEEIDAMYAKPNKRKVLREKSGRVIGDLPESGVLVSNNLYISLSELDSPDTVDLHRSQTLETDL